MFLAFILAAANTIPSGFEKTLADLADPRSREAAIAVLASSGIPVVLPLVKAAPNHTPVVQEAIVDVLVRIGPPGLSASGWPTDVGIRAAVKMGDQVLPQLEEWAPLWSSYRSDFAMRSLRAMGPARGLPVLERLTKHSDQKVRESAFSIIASWGDPKASAPLVDALQVKAGTARYYALKGLTAARDRRVLPTALELVERDGDEMGALALGAMYEPAFRLPLIRAAKNAADVGSRRTAADVLVGVADPIANRLGQRYSVISVGPAAQGRIGVRYTLMLMGTALTVLALLRVGSLFPRGAIVAALAIACGGFAWGNLVTKINGSVERELLLFWIPAVWLVARVMGTKMSHLVDLAIPFATALVGSVIGWVALQTIGRLSTVGWLLVAQFSWVLPVAGFVLGIVIVIKRFARRKQAAPGDIHSVAFTRLATQGVAAFYAGYLIGWWKLWGYSSDAFRALL